MKNLATALLLLASTSAFSQIGLPDINFGVNGIASIDLGGRDDFYDLKVLPDGKILCLVKHQISGTSDNFPAVCRLNPDGSLDLSYGTNGVVILPGQVFLLDQYFQIDIDSENRAIVALTVGDAISVYRLTTAGVLDTDFSFDGLVTVDFALGDEPLADVEVQADDKIVVAASSDEGFTAARLNVDGAFDTSFGTNGKQSHGVQGMERAEDMVIQPDGKVLVCGQTDNGFGNWVGIIRMNPDGSLDASFGDNGQKVKIISSNERAYAIELQSDGKILVLGRTSLSTFDQDGFILRYNSDGSQDNSFDGDGLFPINVSGAADWTTVGIVQPDDKIITGGFYDLNNPDLPIWVTRHNTDGSFDTDFSTDGSTTVSLSNLDLYVRALDFTPNGDLIVGASDSEPSDKDIRLVKLKTGLNISVDELESVDVSVYPNPAVDVLNLKLDDSKGQSIQIEVIDSRGSVVSTEMGNSTNHSFNVEELASGLYTVRVFGEKQVGQTLFLKK